MSNDHETTERKPPHDLDAEKAVIGSILIDPAMIAYVKKITSPGDFHDDRLGIVFNRLLEMSREKTPVDVMTLTNELRAHGEWNDNACEVGTLDSQADAALLAECAHATPVAAHAEYYARIVSDASFRRRLIRALGELVERAYNAAVKVPALKAMAKKLLERIAQ